MLLAAASAMTLLACTQPARCDFLSDLFGARPSVPEGPALTVTRGRTAHPPRRKPSRSRVDAGPPAPKLQRTRDILDDETLRDGDALMAKDGIRIYSGGRSARHTAAQFVPLGSARHVGKDTRALLIALNDARRRHSGNPAVAHLVAAGPGGVSTR